MILWPGWDRQLFLTLNGIDSGFLTGFMQAITNVDNWTPFLLGYILLLLWWGRTRPRPCRGGRWERAFCRRNPRIVLLCLILSVSLSDQVCYHFKHNVDRSRPCFEESLEGLVEYRGEVYGNRSFPSAHAANSTALAVTTSLAYPPLAPFALPLALLVGFSRIYLGVHYPLDVLTGWGIGLTVSLLVWLLFRKMASRGGVIGFTNRFRFRQPVLAPEPGPQWIPVDLNSLDGLPMRGYLKEAGEKLVVLVHGLHGDIGFMTDIGNMFSRWGFSVFLVPLRGHDRHAGRVTSGGPSESYDLAAVLDYLEREGYARERTILYGSSMGAAVAQKSAGLLQNELAGVVAHGGYDSFFAASLRKLGKTKTLVLKLFLPSGVRKSLEVFRPADYSGSLVKTRIVYITGSRDRISPPKTGIRMAGGSGTLSLTLKEAGHPVWRRGMRKPQQLESAVRNAVDFICGKELNNSTIDESGKLSNHSASFREPKEREK